MNTERTLSYWISKAQEIATQAHEGQMRNNGRPYIEHPARVAAAVEDRLKPIAWLHDVIEDTGITLFQLKEEGFEPYVLNAVDLLTHKKGDSNVVYWKKILVNADAIKVKLADIRDNLGESPSEYAKQKYVRALDLFKRAGYSI